MFNNDEALLKRARKEQIAKIAKAIDRAIALDLATAPGPNEPRISATMDLQAAITNGLLDLDRFLKASDADFAHDYALIWAHVDRATGQFPGWFCPRCCTEDEKN